MRRLQWLLVFFGFLMVVFLPPATGKGIIYIDINSPQIRKFYLALPEVEAFDSTPEAIQREMEEALTRNLLVSDLFYLMEREKLPQGGGYITEGTVDF